LHPGSGQDHLPEGTVEDCVQLVKANSIQGAKVECDVGGRADPRGPYIACGGRDS
jgi:hypothetical protein